MSSRYRVIDYACAHVLLDVLLCIIFSRFPCSSIKTGTRMFFVSFYEVHLNNSYGFDNSNTVAVISSENMQNIM